MLEAAAGQLVAEGAQQEVDVSCGHDGAMAPNLVLLHGFTNTGASWDQVVAALPERYRPLAPDIRGHGAASGARPVSLTAVVDDVVALAGGPMELVGYSMGGRIALHVALALAGRVRRLVLIGASPGIADPAARTERRAADDGLAAEVEQMTIEAFAERWAQTAVLADQPAHGAGRGARRSVAQHPGRPGRGPAGSRHGRVAVAVGAAGRADRARGPGGG